MLRGVIAASTDLVMIGARVVLQSESLVEVMAETQTLSELLEILADHQPEILLMDTDFDPVLDILTLIEQTHCAAPRCKLILIGRQTDGLYVRDLMMHGAHSYLYYGDTLRVYLPQAVAQVAHHKPYLSPTVNTEYLIASRFTSRDWQLDSEARQVLDLLAQGHHVNQIAATLGLSRRRVYRIREKLRQRFGSVTNEHMISQAASEGLLRL